MLIPTNDTFKLTTQSFSRHVSLVRDFSVFWLPENILSDRGNELRSKFIDVVCSLLDSEWLKTIPGHPECDSQTKKAVPSTTRSFNVMSCWAPIIETWIASMAQWLQASPWLNWPPQRAHHFSQSKITLRISRARPRPMSEFYLCNEIVWSRSNENNRHLCFEMIFQIQNLL